MPYTEIRYIAMELRKLVKDREWERYHTPANLAKAISIEASELLESFLWANDDLNWKNCPAPLFESLSDEVADVFIYTLQFCDRMGIDLIASTKAKIAKNIEKYPVEKCKGNCQKYTEF